MKRGRRKAAEFARAGGGVARKEPAPHYRVWAAGAACAAALASLLGAFTWIRVQAISERYRLTELDQELRTLTERNRALAAEVETLSSPERLETLASAELGLAAPRPDQIRYLR